MNSLYITRTVFGREVNIPLTEDEVIKLYVKVVKQNNKKERTRELPTMPNEHIIEK